MKFELRNIAEPTVVVDAPKGRHGNSRADRGRFTLLAGVACLALSLVNAGATERLFTYTYEPETMPKGGFEYEQWVTARLTRNDAVEQEHYNRWEFREELEYGLT